jgi:2-polyprenyl-6-methoxyphenol hydroxylase-like FAD-dependent oxidoreductase
MVPVSPSRTFAQLASAGPPRDARVLLRRAVVLGGSVAGLAAARVLSDHCDEVIVIERDTAGTGGPARPGVPHGSQVHSLLPAGQAQLDRWFPGFVAGCAATGSVMIGPDAVSFYTDGAKRALSPTAGPGPGLVSTRPFLEAHIRRRVTALPRVRVLAGQAEDLDIEAGRVTGVRYRPPGDASGTATRLPADLVVDAMGRSSRVAGWLERHGWPAPPLRRMAIRLNYATALFGRATPDEQAQVTVAQYTGVGGGRPRIGGVLPVEGDRWMVLIAGYAGDRPGTDPADFTRRCRDDFPAPFGAVAGGGPLMGEIATYHQADSRRREFHAARLPAGLVAAGDAVASFNPVYGQGMTSALLHAACLSRYLRSGPDLRAPAAGYFGLVKVVADAAWQVSTLPDLALPHVDGPYPRGWKLLSWLGTAIFEASAVDRTVNDQLSRVTVMLAHPSVLGRPDVVLRALRHRALAARAASGTPASP